MYLCMYVHVHVKSRTWTCRTFLSCLQLDSTWLRAERVLVDGDFNDVLELRVRSTLPVTCDVVQEDVLQHCYLDIEVLSEGKSEHVLTCLL